MIFGLDLGTRRATVACPQDRFVFTVSLESAKNRRLFEYEQEAGGEMGRQVSEAIYERYGYSGGHAFFAERPFPRTHGKGANPRTAVGQSISLGALSTHLPGRLHAELPHVWKKELLGNGNAGKDLITSWLTAHRPTLAEVARTQDELDAFCVGVYGESVVAARSLPADEPVGVLRGQARRTDEPAGDRRGSKRVRVLSGAQDLPA